MFKKKIPQNVPNLFGEASLEFIELCRRKAIKIAKKQGTVTIDHVRLATIKDLPEYIDSRIYNQVFNTKFVKENFIKVGETPVRHAGPGARNISVWKLKG